MKFAHLTTIPTLQQWHECLGHQNIRTISNIVKNFNLPCSTFKSPPCSSCFLGKMSRLPLASVEHKSTAPFDIIFSDVWGPAPVVSSLGHRYVVLFIDDYTRFTWIYFLKNKSDVYSCFLQFQSLVDRQFNAKLKAFHSDWGGEYQKLSKLFQSTGIIHRIACPYTHEQNGTSERKIRHLIDTSLTLLAHGDVPLKYWNFAFTMSIQSINQSPSPLLKHKSPHQLLFGKDPNYLDMKPFGCAVFPYLRPYNRHKFAFRSSLCVYLGQIPTHSVYHCLDLATSRIYLARHIKFNITLFPFQSRQTTTSPHTDTSSWLQVTSHPNHWDSGAPSGTNFNSNSTSSFLSPSQQTHPPTSSSSSPSHTTSISHNNSTSPPPIPTSPHLNLIVDLSSYNNPITSTTTTSPPEPHPIQPTQPIRMHHMNLRPTTLSKHQAHLSTRTIINFLTQEPNTYNQAKPYAEWRNAMTKEIDALITNNTWTLVPRPSYKNIIGNKWLFRIKRKADGSIERYKA